MREEFALHYAERRAKERGYSAYQIIHREFVIPENGMLKFQAYNELWFVTFIDWGLIVKSDYGRYQNWFAKGITENTHEHGDRIEIMNTQNERRTIRFLQVILKTKVDDAKI